MNYFNEQNTSGYCVTELNAFDRQLDRDILAFLIANDVTFYSDECYQFKKNQSEKLLTYYDTNKCFFIITSGEEVVKTNDEKSIPEKCKQLHSITGLSVICDSYKGIICAIPTEI